MKIFFRQIKTKFNNFIDAKNYLTLYYTILYYIIITHIDKSKSKVIKLNACCILSFPPRSMDKISPHSLSMKNKSSSVAPLGASTQSRTTAQTMSCMERLVIELSNPDLRENALRVLSKVLTNLSSIIIIFVCF